MKRLSLTLAAACLLLLPSCLTTGDPDRPEMGLHGFIGDRASVGLEMPIPWIPNPGIAFTLKRATVAPDADEGELPAPAPQPIFLPSFK